MSSLITMPEFVSSLRKQFIFQNGKFGKRKNHYYTVCSKRWGLKNDYWGMIVFIYVAPQYGFTNTEIIDELKIGASLYEILLNETPALTQKNCPDQKLHQTIMVKAGLVKNHIRATYMVTPKCRDVFI